MIKEINGHTAVYGVIGDPVSHSFSPQIHGYFADLCGINMAYLPFHVKEAEVPNAINGAHALGIHGLNITVPHKKTILPHLTQVDVMAKRVGTVNTLMWTDRGYIGHNTDYIGIQHTLASLGMSFKNSTVVILGAGGTAYAACIAAADQGAKELTIINRTRENAIFLASHANTYYNVPVNVLGFEAFSNLSVKPDIVVQTTTIGFGEAQDHSPVPDSYKKFFRDVQVAFDIIYSPWETAFMRQAQEADVPKIVNGFPMLVYQAAAAFDLWHGTEIIKNGDMETHVKALAKKATMA